ncbi:cytosol aminopeptidase family, catalytic domain-containing protein [Mycena rosella]|uniref:leucyl aminopeptidase n=1 Tax=Mycena rosella TaxID=1033263 RepID=A0AAD7DQK9_MYCRO|nr:cytosol aminopeptidase family, catalytic domain-containing protein [Mycena rosella]
MFQRALLPRIARRKMATASIHPFDPKTPSQSANELWAASATKAPKVGTTRIIFKPDSIIALASLGPDFVNKNGAAKRELVRRSVGSAVKEITRVAEEVTEVVVDASADPHAAAVAAHLALYSFTLKTDPPSAFNPNLKEPIPEKVALKALDASPEWDQGVVYAQAQNLARTLMELPGNMLTPTIFSQRVQAEFEGIENVEIFVRDEVWAAEKGMRTFLSVSRGSAEPAKFVEIHYKGAASTDAAPLVLVGKGITFDSGGISLKPGNDMKLMRGDMGGAAAVVSAALAIAQLKLPINMVVLTPLSENMPSGTATKPGDIFYAMNGKTVEVDNTDAEGRLVLSDAIYYGSTEFNAHTLIDVATLTGAMDIALGEVFTGVFSTSDALWEGLHAAGETEYDRFWRMPLDDDYGAQIYSSNADLQNTGGKPAGSCTAALFLKAFVHGLEPTDGKAPLAWAHIDIAGTMEATRPTPYLGRGMTGSSVRALVEYARRLAEA